MKLLLAAAICALACASAWSEERRSGYAYMSRATQAMQDDDFANPGMLAVEEGEALFRKRAGAAGKACAECHEKAGMKGVATRYPAPDTASGLPISLEQRINRCRTARQQAPEFALESKELLALTGYVAHQSRGLPIAPPDPALREFVEAGKAQFHRRQGQINLACSQCHDLNAGKKLAGTPIPQAHPTGYPIYRLEWQSMGSLQRRLRNCLTGMRAEPFAYGSRELVELELYLKARASGMPIETPGVRP